MAKHWQQVLILLIFSLIGIKALIHSGWYTSHDGEHQLVRQYIFDRGAKAGHIPPRIDRQLLNGLGYPLMTFTYQAPFILGEPFRLLGISTQDTVKLVFILSFFASGLAMYLFAGLLPAIMYLWAPYRFSVIYVRASLGEHLAFVFLPLILWSLNNKFITQKKRLIIGSLSLAGLLLSHLMTAQIFLPLIILYALYQLITAKNKRLVAGTYCLMAILGLGLSGYYLLPALVHRSAIQGLNRHFYTEHFPTLKQIIYSRWDYGFSQIGTANDGMSFQLGIAHWLIIALAIFISLKKFSLRNSVFIISFILAIFMSLPISTNLWDYFIRRQSWFIIDIPWRWLGLATASTAILAGSVLSRAKNLIKLVFLGLVLSLVIYGNRNHLRVNEYVNYPDERLASFRGSGTSYDEYQSAYAKESMVKGPALKPVEVRSGAAQINIGTSLPHQLIFTTQVSNTAQLQINTVYFPGWTLNINNQLQDIESTLTEGVPRITLRPGTYTVSLVYRQTPVMQLGNIITLISLIALVFIWQQKAK